MGIFRRSSKPCGFTSPRLRGDRRLLYAWAVAGGICLSGPVASADLYRCLAADGSTVYSDTPCAPGAKRVEVQGASAQHSPTPLGIEITSASYVSERSGQTLDVTQPMRAHCPPGSNACMIKCGNDLAGDPAFGERKYCNVSLQCNGRAEQRRILEGNGLGEFCPYPGHTAATFDAQSGNSGTGTPAGTPSPASTLNASGPSDAGAASYAASVKLANCDSIVSPLGITLTSGKGPGQQLTTTCSFRPPVEITVVAKTEDTNLRLAYAADQIIFNWELDRSQLRIDGGPANGKHKMGAGAIPIREYVTVRWLVTPSMQSVYVDGELRFQDSGDYSEINRPVTVFAAEGSTIVVKSIVVRRLSQATVQRLPSVNYVLSVPTLRPRISPAFQRQISELRDIVMGFDGSRNLTSALNLVAAAHLRFMAPPGDTWGPGNPHWDALSKTMQADLRRDVEPAFQESLAETASRLDSALATAVSEAQAQQMLSYFHSPIGRRFQAFQRRLALIEIPTTVPALVAPGAVQTTRPDTAVRETRLRIAALSWRANVLQATNPTDGIAGSAPPKAASALAAFLDLAIANGGPELDALQRQYQSELNDFRAIEQSTTYRSLLSAYQLQARRIAGQSRTLDPLTQAIVRSVGAHSAAWTTAYYASRSPSVIVQHPSSTGKNGEFPDEPLENLPIIHALPRRGGVVLEFGDVTGRPQNPTKFLARVFDLENRTKSFWSAEGAMLSQLAPQSSFQRVSWSPGIRKLLYATRDSLYLIAPDGTSALLHPQMPPLLAPEQGMETFALSNDGSSVAYWLYTRDRANKLYMNLMYQSVAGAQPISIMSGEHRPSSIAWRPDDRAIAYSSGELIALIDLSGRQIFAIRPLGPRQVLDAANFIDELRWDPAGTRIGFVTGGRHLYLIDADGSHLREVRFSHPGSPEEVPVYAFAWSPDGRHFVISSSYEAHAICNNSPGYKFETGSLPCIPAYNLYITDTDGRNLRRITPRDEYSTPMGDLFWIQ